MDPASLQWYQWLGMAVLAAIATTFSLIMSQDNRLWFALTAVAGPLCLLYLAVGLIRFVKFVWESK